MPSDLLKIMSALSSTRKKNSSPRVLCLWFFLIAHSFFSKIQRLCRLHAFFALFSDYIFIFLRIRKLLLHLCLNWVQILLYL